MYLAHLRRAVEILGADDPAIAGILLGRSPEEAVQALTSGSHIHNDEFVQECLAGGWEALNQREDEALAAANGIRGMLRQHEADKARLDLEIQVATARIGEARYAVHGFEVTSDATFSLRFSPGEVQGYATNGTRYPAWTSFYGLYARNSEFDDQGEFKLPPIWHARRGQLDMTLPVNYVSTADLIGGSSGSPVINEDREVVGLIFDGNQEAIQNLFVFRDDVPRAVNVHSQAIIETLSLVYDQHELVAELLGED